jgi:hypothetical protein
MAIVISLMVGVFLAWILTLAEDHLDKPSPVIREPIKPLPPAPKSLKIYLATLSIVIFLGLFTGVLPAPPVTRSRLLPATSELQKQIPVPVRSVLSCVPPKCREI